MTEKKGEPSSYIKVIYRHHKVLKMAKVQETLGGLVSITEVLPYQL